MNVHLLVEERPRTSYAQPGITEMMSVRMDVAITTGVDAFVRMVRCNLELVFKRVSEVTICTNIKMVIIFFYISILNKLSFYCELFI